MERMGRPARRRRREGSGREAPQALDLEGAQSTGRGRSSLPLLLGSRVQARPAGTRAQESTPKTL